MRTPHPIARIGTRVAFWAAAGICLLASHDLVFLAQVGPGDEVTRLLRQAGHGYWTVASAVLAVLALAGAVVAVLRLRALRHSAERLRAPRVKVPATPVRRWATTWGRLGLVVLVGFALQENVEHWFQHGHVLGFGTLVGPDYPLAIPTIALVTAVVAGAVAVVQRTEAELIVRLAVVLSARPRPVRRQPRPAQRVVRAHLAPLARAAAGRAPPSLALRTG